MKQVVIDYTEYHKEKNEIRAEGVNHGLWLAYKYLTNPNVWPLSKDQAYEKECLDLAKQDIIKQLSVMS